MNARTLKSLLIIVCCFVVVLCSEIKSMDTASGLQETTPYKTKNINSEGCLNRLEPENENLAASWVSYVVSPAKSAIGWTCNVADFSVKHPTQAMITSLLVAAQFTAIAANYCNCVWDCVEPDGNYAGEESRMPRSLGMFPNSTACMSVSGNSWDGYYQACTYNGCY